MGSEIGRTIFAVIGDRFFERCPICNHRVLIHLDNIHLKPPCQITWRCDKCGQFFWKIEIAQAVQSGITREDKPDD